MTQLKEYFGDRIEVKVLSGGLFLGNRAGSVNEVAPHIKSGAYKRVEQLTGVKFGEPFLSDVFGDGQTVLNSLPPSIALCIVKEKFPEKELKFAGLLLKAVYFDGLSSTDLDGLGDYAATVGFDKKEFLRKMKEEKYKILAEKEFSDFKFSQYAAMPALVAVVDDKEVPLSSGFTAFEGLKLKISSLLTD